MSEPRDLQIQLPDGYSAYACYWPADKPGPAVMHLHGIQSHCGWYTPTARALNDAGYHVLQVDRRGSGRNTVDRGHAASPEQLIDDAVTCVDSLRDLSGAARVHVIGVSWGGKLAAALHVIASECVESLALVAPGIYPVVDVNAFEKFRIGLAMVSNPSQHFDIPLNDPELFTDQPEWIEWLRRDELQIHQATAGFYLASRRMDRIVSRLPNARPVPIHLLLSGDERIIDNERTRALVRDLTWPTRVITTYPHARHTLEFSTDRNTFHEDLLRWMQSPNTYTPVEVLTG